MHGREGEVRKRTRYMWPVRTRGTKTVLADHFSSPSTANSFSKDGRTICVGDCALFKPPEDSPPFIGFIRCLSSGEDTSATLGVNWLYRPAELELGKGILLGAAPNEVFYSFHSDEIPAASLLHPCKVAFLPKGIELPPGISAFVCRRVYDIANKRLWWLTDQNFVNERQEEIDKLLHKTKKEMHGMVQPDGRSPKAMSGPTSTTQLKSGSDNAQNTGSSFGPQVKGKKRERVDQGFEPVKRERTSKGDADFVQFTTERVLKSEIVKITDRGGLVDMEGVEKLVQLMTPEKSDRKIDLACRSLLAGVIAVSDNFDCLSRFVQLRGLPVLDEWLQEVHKGKIDGSSPKDNDKSVEEFLFILLRALDKLPVNLNALQTCNIGKSVNHLRTHKDLDIQKKARSLVDKWKKRVEAEMNSHDAKSGSGQAVPWSARSRHGEVSHGGNRNMGGPSEATMKSSITQVSALRNVSVKPSQGEALKSASASASPRPAKPVASSASESTNSKDGQPRIAGACGASEPLQTTGRDEKSSSSSQSHNNSQSCSSDQNKLVGLQGKEDARSSTAVSMSVNKLVSGASRHRKTVNGYQGHTASGVQRESGSNRSSLHKNASEKLSQSGLTCEKNSDAPVAEGSCHKLIVKIPNRGRSPIPSSGGGTLEDPSVMNSRASSPVMSDKHEPFDRNLKEKSDSSRANITSDVKTESWQSNDFKDVLTGSDEGDGSPAVVPDEDRSRTAGGDRKLADLPRAASSSSGNEAKPGKLHEPSFSSINALAESCVKYSEADASVSVGDDVGMNLLASVAAGEMLKSDVVLQTESQVQGSNLHSDSCTANDTNPKASSRRDLAQGNTQNNNGADDDIKRQEITVSGSWHKDGLRRSLSKHASTSSGDGKTVCSCGERFDKQNEHNAFCPCRQGNYKPDDKITSVAGSAAVPAAFSMEKSSSGGEGQHSHETKAVPTGVNGDSTPEFKLNVSYSDEKGNVLYTNGEKKKLLSSYSVLKGEGDVKNTVKEEMNQGTVREQKTASALTNSEPPKSTSEGVSPPSTSGKDLASEKLERKDDCADDMRSRSHVNQVGNHKKEQESNASPTHKDSAVADNGLECREEKENKKYLEHRHGGSAGTEVEEKEECASTTADSSPTSVPGASDTDTKLEFDLNEGYNVDDGKYAEPINLVPPGCSASVNLVSPLPFPLSSVSSGLPASITVAAAAKGPFLPPDNLLRCKGKLGWKGSAATSAFRPAEPRKVLEMPLGSSGATLSDAASGKQGRRPLDFDLNVPDERVFEEMACRNFAEDTGSTVDTSNYHDLAHNSAPGRPSGGLDFDLNRVDEAMDVGQCSTSNGHRLQAPILCAKSSASGGFPNGEVSFRGNFDLNNGPGTDEMNVEPSPYSQRMRSNIHTQTPVACVRMNNAEMGNFSSWFPPGNTYSAVTIPSILPDRGGEQSFPIVATGGPPRILSSHIGGSPLAPDAYRGQVLSSSPAASFPSAPFQYPVFPFGTSFPLPSATFSVNSTTYMDSSSGGRLCFPAIHSQLLGPASAVSSQFPRPYMISLPDGVNNGALDSNKKWGKQGLDLNAGPGGPEMEGRDETLPLAPGQLSLTGSQALAEEQARMYHLTSGILKRKDPEGGWDSERFSYKQSSWQ